MWCITPVKAVVSGHPLAVYAVTAAVVDIVVTAAVATVVAVVETTLFSIIMLKLGWR